MKKSIFGNLTLPDILKLVAFLFFVGYFIYTIYGLPSKVDNYEGCIQ